MDNQTLWKITLEQLELEISPPALQTWFSKTAIINREGPLIEIGCPTSYIRNRLETYHQAQIKKILDQITKESTNIIFKVAKTAPSGRPDRPLGPLFNKEEKMSTSRHRRAGLSPQYTFNNFVVGNNNNLAFAVAAGIAENPGKKYNPFFLHSDVGLGKTHLMQAIGNKILENNPHLKVLYCTSENFANQLIQAIQNRTTARFKQKFRNVDLLLIDDIQFIAGRESTQEEFFHTFNALYLDQKQIVLTSDKPPKEIPKLEKRLSSRFGSGMTADIQPPDIDIRLAILRKKREILGLEVDDDVLAFVAGAVPSNVRDLEGALNVVVTLAQTQQVSPTIELARQAIDTRTTKEPPTPEKIIHTVCEYFTVQPKELKGKRRPARIAQPRQIAMYLMRAEAQLPFAEIGNELGGRDHTTVMHGVAKIEKLIHQDAGVGEQVRVIKSKIGG